MKKKAKQYKFNIKNACLENGIENPHQLWLKLGGSKATTASFWHDEDLGMIRLETVNKLCEILNVTPADLFREVDSK